MIGNFKTTNDSDIAALLEKPKRIEKFLYGETFSTEPEKKSFFGFFKEKASKEADYWMPSDSGEEMNIDKLTKLPQLYRRWTKLKSNPGATQKSSRRTMSIQIYGMKISTSLLDTF